MLRKRGGKFSKRRVGVLQRPYGPERSTNKSIDRRVNVVILLPCPEAFVRAFVNRGQEVGGS